MSHLTSDTNIEYVAVYFYDRLDKCNIPDGESCGYKTPEEAIEDAQEYIADKVESSGIYAWAKIETRVVPIYR